MATKISIISRALNLLGQIPQIDISDFPGNNTALGAANDWYENIVLNALSEKQPWRFAMAIKQLNLLAAEPPNDKWKNIFQIPTDQNYIVNYRVYDGQFDIVDYDIYEDKLYTDEGTVYMDYVFNPEAEKFPPYFELLIIYELATVLAMPVTQEINIANTWASAARTQKLAARAVDSALTPATSFPNGPLFNAHVSSGNGGYILTR